MLNLPVVESGEQKQHHLRKEVRTETKESGHEKIIFREGSGPELANQST